MKNKVLCMIVVILGCLFLRDTVGAATTLTVLTFAVRDSVWVKNFQVFTAEAEKRSGGRVKFKYVGGPEAVPPFEQIDALKRGIVDVALIPGAYFVSHLPEADAMKLSPYLPWEERKNGVYAFFNDLMQEKMGVYYLGRVTGGIKYHFYLKKGVKAAEFKGLKVRVTPIYEPFVRALGGIPVATAPGEVYIALERGVVDGFGWPSIGVRDLGWQEVVKYVIEPGFYQTDVCVLVNLQKWKGLEAGVRKLLADVMRDAERESYELSRKMAGRDRELLQRKGLEFIEFTGAERDRYLGTALRAGWEKVLARSPVLGPKLKEMMSK